MEFLSRVVKDSRPHRSSVRSHPANDVSPLSVSTFAAPIAEDAALSSTIHNNTSQTQSSLGDTSTTPTGVLPKVNNESPRNDAREMPSLFKNNSTENSKKIIEPATPPPLNEQPDSKQDRFTQSNTQFIEAGIQTTKSKPLFYSSQQPLSKESELSDKAVDPTLPSVTLMSESGSDSGFEKPALEPNEKVFTHEDGLPVSDDKSTATPDHSPLSIESIVASQNRESKNQQQSVVEKQKVIEDTTTINNYNRRDKEPAPEIKHDSFMPVKDTETQLNTLNADWQQAHVDSTNKVETEPRVTIGQIDVIIQSAPGTATKQSPVADNNDMASRRYMRRL